MYPGPAMRRLQIRVNRLLHGGEPSMSLNEMMKVRESLGAEKSLDPRLHNLEAALSAAEMVHAEYGESGLFRLFLFAGTAGRDFDHFFDVIIWLVAELRLPTAEIGPELECDNDKLPQGKQMAEVNSHVMIPSFARKLYNPGRHHGYLVYGLGGPRILISHPFRGSNGELYDVYANSVDVATSLITRGYNGTFLFLDNMPGLNQQFSGHPAWLLWFSMIAAQSDMVIFIKDDKGLGHWQQREVEFTPDRVQKKIVEIPSRELKWAEQHEERPLPTLYSHEGKAITREQYLDFERQHSAPLLQQYVQPGIRKDALFRVDAESGELAEYPLDYPLYD